MLSWHGSVVPIDAMGGQVALARQSIDQGGAYGLSLQEHQPRLPKECEEVFPWLRGPHPLAAAAGLGDNEQGAGGLGASRPAEYGARRRLRGWGHGHGGRAGRRWSW
jgi:hypothetical protein